jgi:hypothetical protein
MRKYMLLSAFLVSAVAFGQKVKLEETIAFVDDVEYIYYEKQNMANDASVKGLKADHEELFLTYQSYVDPNLITKSNPEGKVRWVEFNFLDLGIKCEVQNHTHKAMVKLIYENNLFVDGKIDPEAAQRFVSKYGMKFTEGRRNGNVNIIINN